MNPAFLITPVYLLLLFGALFFVQYNRLKANGNLRDRILASIKRDVIEIIPNIEAECLLTGRNSQQAVNARFRRCDLYILPDAIFIDTYRVFFGKKMSKQPLLITKDMAKYAGFATLNALPDIKKINPDSFSKSVYIEYGEATFETYSVDIHLYGLTDSQRDYFRF